MGGRGEGHGRKVGCAGMAGLAHAISSRLRQLLQVAAFEGRLDIPPRFPEILEQECLSLLKRGRPWRRGARLGARGQQVAAVLPDGSLAAQKRSILRLGEAKAGG